MRSHSATNSAAVFHALADLTRRAVLDLLRAEILPAGQIARSFPISRPAISRHLRLLRREALEAHVAVDLDSTGPGDLAEVASTVVVAAVMVTDTKWGDKYRLPLR